MTVSIGISQGPHHAMNPRELVACAESAMMAAKARGKNQTVLYDDGPTERPAPGAAAVARDVRSIAHLKMLQSLAGKLNRLNDVRQIGQTIATELRLLIDYHNCRVVLRDGDQLRPITFVGDYDSSVHSAADAYTQRVGVGITGRVAETGESLLVPNALECEFGFRIPGTQEIEESLALVPLRYGSRVTGVIVISKLGLNQFDEDDVRLLEVLAGQASVALENARLYEQQRREAEGAKALLAFADVVSRAHTVEEICEHMVETAVSLFETEGASLWLGDACVASVGPPLTEGTSSPLAEGDGIEGRLVLAATALDEDRERLLASFSYQASVALQKAHLYGKQLEAAEIANSLLEASRELATAESPDDVLARSVEVTARVLGTERAALWIQEDAAPGDLVARASSGYAPDVDPARGPAVPGHARARVARGPHRAVRARAGRRRAHRRRRRRSDRPLRDRSAAARGQSRRRAHRRRSATASSTTGSCASSPVSPTRRSWRSRARRTSRASSTRSSRRSRRSRTRSRRTTRTRRRTPAGSPTWRCSSAASCGLDRDTLKRLELGALFHDIGKIGIPSEILQKPGPLTEEEFEIVKQHPGAGREDPRADRPARRRAPDRARLPRALGRARLPGRQGRATRSRSRRGSCSSATRSTRWSPTVPYRKQPAGRRGGPPPARGGRARSSIPTSWRRSAASSTPARCCRSSGRPPGGRCRRRPGSRGA